MNNKIIKDSGWVSVRNLRIRGIEDFERVFVVKEPLSPEEISELEKFVRTDKNPGNTAIILIKPQTNEYVFRTTMDTSD